MSSIVMPELPAPASPPIPAASSPQPARRRSRWLAGVILYCLTGAVPLLFLRGVFVSLAFLAVIMVFLVITAELRGERRRDSLAAAQSPPGSTGAPATYGRGATVVINGAAGLFLVASIAWAAWRPGTAEVTTTYETAAPTPAAPAIPEARKQEAIALLDGAATARQQESFTSALSLAAQSLQVWPENEGARQFVKDVSLQATAQAAAAAQSQAAILAKATAVAVQARRSAYFGYANKLTPLSNRYRVTLSTVIMLTDQTKTSPYVTTSVEWGTQLDSALIALLETSSQMAAVTPVPPEMVPVAEQMNVLHRQTAELASNLGRAPGASAAPDLASAASSLEQINVTIARARTGVQQYIPSQ